MAREGERSVLAFDFGTKSIGVAIGQELTGSAKPLTAIKAQDGIPSWPLLEKLLEQWQPDLLVIGLPLNMDGTEQDITSRAKKFANRLHGRFGYQIAMQDERLTTVDAKEKLFELGGYKALEKGAVDSLAAALIFESWCAEQY
ncbi:MULTISPECIES: Holliday junction resolvase RuvX [unclassified Agarivorans]|uniref:Holliday junction resolvase RuvX n=1 Tax=unclassified Agarivorans TaxID=2636026 RepID=UPI0026E116A3|nr:MULTISPECIES: Holliday junction resolvase RuvX [unclassified Agarivorans]MDO6686981.1 Holliday junction resolvase RuvX [Agarivorans sp. 3_MG-2023]MDO6716778.1 Holliday junction resolvase RuvX [Agarivorans sp. 2_MG-2023]MDO6764482.1 Holliday junction resolvase RuvX [Agarivorans sp. 1_MG-2023]